MAWADIFICRSRVLICSPWSCPSSQLMSSQHLANIVTKSNRCSLRCRAYITLNVCLTSKQHLQLTSNVNVGPTSKQHLQRRENQQNWLGQHCLDVLYKIYIIYWQDVGPIFVIYIEPTAICHTLNRCWLDINWLPG